MEVIQVRSSRLLRYTTPEPLSNSPLFGNKRYQTLSTHHQAAGIIGKYAAKKLKNAVQTLCQLSLPRQITTLSGKKVQNFRSQMVTLTLPAPQFHTDQHIKENCLNQFLTEIRQKRKVNNYVWKAELQNNGNVHFHIVIDQFVDYYVVRKTWNRIIKKLGYIEKYAEKMAKLTMPQYLQLRESAVASFPTRQFSEKQAMRANWKVAYQKGVAAGWTIPNTVDVKFIHNERQLGSYLSKYLAKNLCEESSTEKINPERLETFGRLWGCSYSLSKFKQARTSKDWRIYEIYTELKKTAKTIVRRFDYCEAIYFDLAKIPKKIASYIKEFTFANAINQRYYYPVPVANSS